MSFIGAVEEGKCYAAGWFLANNEDCTRVTRQVAQANATTVGTKKIVKMGSFYPANNAATVEGIVYEDVDVTSGDMPASVVTKGEVYTSRLAAEPGSGVQAALEAKGFKFVTEPTVTRP